MENRKPSFQTPVAVILLCALVCFTGIFDRDLWTPDEPRDAAVCLEMAQTGDILVPHLAGRPFVEKPPLYFAVGSAFARVWGGLLGWTGAIRLVSALFGLGVLGFTYLIGRRLFDRELGVLAAALLATMAGFVENFHWIRVDPALAFFVAGAAWCLVEALSGNRRGLLPAAALFAAGGFLSKGVVAVVFIGAAWVGLVATLFIRRRAGDRQPLMIAGHALALAVFILIVGGWMWAFRISAGKELWDEWFWTNHFGRALGTAPQLGHLKEGKPFYYIGTILMYALPWVPLAVPWIISLARNRKELHSRTDDLFLAAWIAVSTIALSLSTTKRDVYLCPLLPALALACARGFAGIRADGRPARILGWAWAATCVAACAAAAGTWPLALKVKSLGFDVDERALPFLASFTPRHFLALVALALCAWTIFSRGAGSILSPLRIIAPTALAWFALIVVPGHAVDLVKSMSYETRAFVAQIPTWERASIAVWKPSETIRGCFHYYADWKPESIDDPARLTAILSGKDPEYSAVVVVNETAPVMEGLPPHRTDAIARLGPGDGREVRLVRPRTD